MSVVTANQVHRLSKGNHTINCEPGKVIKIKLCESFEVNINVRIKSSDIFNIIISNELLLRIQSSLIIFNKY